MEIQMLGVTRGSVGIVAKPVVVVLTAVKIVAHKLHVPWCAATIRATIIKVGHF